MNKSEAARLGGLARIAQHGNPGTAEGRRLGGTRSNGTRKIDFARPKNSSSLAEFMGILVGDGHLAKYQVSVSTSSLTDSEHAAYIAQLSEKLFDIKTTIRKKKDRNALEVVISSLTWLNG